MERMFGLETEYGIRVRDRLGARLDGTDEFWQSLRCTARQRLVHLPERDGYGMFLGNAARFYFDCGHPEFATPECANPWDAVRYSLAGDRILGDVLRAWAETHGNLTEAALFKCNVDYSGSHSTWGSHESYLHSANPDEMACQLIPFLASRIIFTGAGGFDPTAAGAVFMLSPRAVHLGHATSAESTSSRGIVHTKDEPLCDGDYHRLHLICGECLCSHTALWLRVATTALVVAMIETGLRPGDQVRLRDPVRAMRAFACDPTCRLAVTAAPDGQLTALAIQRHYLAMAQAHQCDSFMPPWAEEACRQWDRILSLLEQGPPDSVNTLLDWAIKRSLYTRQIANHGLSWESLLLWNDVLADIQRALAGAECDAHRITPELVLGAESPIAADVRRMTPKLLLKGLSWDGLGSVCDLRARLFEIDTRFSEQSERGIFNVLDRAGVLRHPFPGVDNIEHAMAHPPAIGRAKVRGECIRRLAGNNGRYSCSWDSVWDFTERRFLDLAQPFVSGEKWKSLPAPRTEERSSLGTGIDGQLQRALDLYGQGRFEEAAAVLHAIASHRLAFRSDQLADYLCYMSWVQTRRGFLDSIGYMDALAQRHPQDLFLVTEYVCAYRFQGLVPPAETLVWIRKGEEMLARECSQSPGIAAAFLGHQGYCLMRSGQFEKARVVLEQATNPQSRQSGHPRIIARSLADLSETQRLLGNREQAKRLLQEAQQSQTISGFSGDLADFTYLYFSKLENDRNMAIWWLTQAKAIHTRNADRLGEARRILLEARLRNHPLFGADSRNHFTALREALPSLRQCPLAKRILDRWDNWVSGQPADDGNPDPFWGV